MFYNRDVVVEVVVGGVGEASAKGVPKHMERLFSEKLFRKMQ